jgi:hypothetical protein
LIALPGTKNKERQNMIEISKILRVILSLLPLLSLQGCFKQDYSMCPPDYNVRLDLGLAGNDDFAENVVSVDAYIYDVAGNYLYTEHLDKSELNDYRGLQLWLAPGDYRMVFWANIGTNTVVRGDVGDAGYVGYSDSSYNAGGFVIADADRLWYAPCVDQRGDDRGIPQDYYSLRVPAEGVYSDTVLFGYAYRSIEIYVEGLTALPTLYIEGAPERVGFMGMKDLPTRTVTVSHETESVEQSGVEYATATFDTFYFEDTAESGMEIVILNTAGTELCRTSLADAIAQSGADSTARTIRLLFKFLSGNITITMPGWNSTTPGFEW